MREQTISKSNILHVIFSSIEGREAKKVITLTRGRSVGGPETCNYDIALLSTTAM